MIRRVELRSIVDPRLILSTDNTSLGLPELHCVSFFEIIELVTALMKAGGCEISQGDCAGHALLLCGGKWA